MPKKDTPDFGKNVYVERIEITPHIAMNWLNQVPEFQRKEDPNQVQKIAYAIRKGEWRENGSTIVFNENGDLIDGQHRLRAIAISGKTVPSLVVTGVSKDQTTFDTLGDVKPRKITDFLHCKNSSMISSVIRLQWHINAKNPNWYGSKDGGSASKDFNAPIVDLIRLSRKIVPEIEPLAEAFLRSGVCRVMSQGSFGLFLVYYFKQRSIKHEMERVSKYFTQIGDGVGLERTDPAYLVRQKFLQIRSTEAIPRLVARAIILKGLNHQLKDESVSRITFDPNREEFPKLIGYEIPKREDKD